MADTNLSIEQIELGIAQYYNFRVNMVVPNVSWGLLNHEADVIVMSRAGYLTEIEIKRSWSDFNADFRKKHQHDDKLISWYYYAVPQSISEKCRQKLSELDPNKKWGLLEYSEYMGECYVTLVFHPNNINEHLKHRKLSDKDQYQIARLGALRSWTLKNKIIKLQKTIHSNKMKTYVIMLSKVFPKGHIRQGEPTEFKYKLLNGEKIHTIRSNYELWEKRIKEVQNGEAIISVRQWEDKPYRSKQIEIAQFGQDDGIGIEKLFLPPIGQMEFILKSHPNLDLHDGLDRLDWLSWFECAERNKPLPIIHFTPFRYETNG